MAIRWGQRHGFSYLLPSGELIAVPFVEKLKQTHIRSRDMEAAGGLTHKCDGCDVTPVEEVQSGPQKGQSPDTTLHCVSGARPGRCESGLSDCSLRSASEGGDVQSKSSQNYGHARRNYAYGPRCVACGDAQPSGNSHSKAAV